MNRLIAKEKDNMDFYDISDGIPPEIPEPIKPVIKVVKALHESIRGLAERYCGMMCMLEVISKRHKLDDIGKQLGADVLSICKDGVATICMLPEDGDDVCDFPAKRRLECEALMARLNRISEYSVAWPHNAYARPFVNDAFAGMLSDDFTEIDAAWVCVLNTFKERSGVIGNAADFLLSVVPLGQTLLDNHTGHTYSPDERTRTMSMLGLYERLYDAGATETEALEQCKHSMQAIMDKETPAIMQDDDAMEDALQVLVAKDNKGGR